MTKNSKNENFFMVTFLWWQTKIRQEMNILISPSNNCSLAKTKTRILTQFGQKKRQKQKYENNNFVLLPNIISHVITAFCQKKILLYVDEYFEIIFSSCFGLSL